MVFAYFWKAFRIKLFCTRCTARRIIENLLCCSALWIVRFKRDRVGGQRNSHIRSRNDQWMGPFWGDLESRTYMETAICVMCSKEIAEESLKPNKLLRHMNTHKDVASLTDEGRKRVYKQRFDNLSQRSNDLSYFHTRQLILLLERSDHTWRVRPNKACA